MSFQIQSFYRVSTLLVAATGLSCAAVVARPSSKTTPKPQKKLEPSTTILRAEFHCLQLKGEIPRIIGCRDRLGVLKGDFEKATHPLGLHGCEVKKVNDEVLKLECLPIVEGVYDEKGAGEMATEFVRSVGVIRGRSEYSNSQTGVSRWNLEKRIQTVCEKITQAQVFGALRARGMFGFVLEQKVGDSVSVHTYCEPIGD